MCVVAVALRGTGIGMQSASSRIGEGRVGTELTAINMSGCVLFCVAERCVLVVLLCCTVSNGFVVKFMYEVSLVFCS